MNSDEGIPYLIIDETRSPWGHEFYRVFSQLWKSPRGVPTYYIYVKEKRISSSLKQSWIYVEIGNNIVNRTVFVSLVRPASGEIERKALKAIKSSYMFLLKDYYKLYNLTKQF